MSEQKDNLNRTQDKSVSQEQESTIPSSKHVGQTESKPIATAKAAQKKSFSERMKTHRFWLVRGIYYMFYSVWAVVMAIGMFIAWLIAMLFI
ncbi:hypothetical protein [Gelidibacter sp.]|uniref:hypothetical protein n=1 Tax=Gelidibacter sp. TaxID=2018083 RepID=UPI002BCEF830|nr:hypothetical protein [Gelidibacter sp.]HUH27912.1 hypothetical protein [Gelidibacter sp.]